MTAIRKKAAEGLRAGDRFTVTRTITEQDMVLFADITRDYNPVHFDDRFARIKNFENRICHGLLVASLVTEIGGQIGWLASGMQFTFIKPVFFGDTITCNLKVTQIDNKGRAEAECIFTNQSESVVLTATLNGIIPGTNEKQILKSMLAEGDPTNKCT